LGPAGPAEEVPAGDPGPVRGPGIEAAGEAAGGPLRVGDRHAGRAGPRRQVQRRDGVTGRDGRGTPNVERDVMAGDRPIGEGPPTAGDDADTLAAPAPAGPPSDAPTLGLPPSADDPF